MHPTTQLIDWINQRKALACHRQLLVVTGNEGWAVESAGILLSQTKHKSVLWYGEGAPNGIFSSKQFKSSLGQEYECVVINGFSGLRGNALMALSGCVAKHGVMVLLCPTLESWHSYQDPQLSSRVSYGFEQTSFSSHFVTWLVRHIRSDPHVCVITKDDFSGDIALVEARIQQTTNAFCATLDQAKVVNEILSLSERNSGHLVITADRGRGKSSALGIAASVSGNRIGKTAIVTSTHPSQTKTLFAIYEDIKRNQTEDSDEITSLTYLPFDVLLEKKPIADILFIDEAASIPNRVLEQLVLNYPRVVFSTTVNGYEGSGRGFSLRFKPYMSKRFPGTAFLTMQTPIRWYNGDCLESFWNRAFAMDDEDVEKINHYTYKNDSSYNETTQYLCLQGIDLIKQGQLLTQVFSLLVDAHYQTTPDDLVRMLDAPDHRVHMLVNKTNNNKIGHPLAVALTVEEGGETLTALAEPITKGQRRVSGHLTAQRLAFEFADESYATLTYIRVVRIAVVNDARRQSLGSTLLVKIEDFANEKSIAALSTSFGVTCELLPFWQKAQFKLVKMGIKKDASSGEYSALMLKPLREAFISDSKMMHDIALHQLSYQKDYRLKDFPLNLFNKLMVDASALSDSISYSNQIEKVVMSFAIGHRPLSNSEWYLTRWLNEGCCSNTGAVLQQLIKSDDAKHFLNKLLVDKTSYALLQEEYNLTGKKDIEAFARQCVASLLLNKD